MALICAAAVSVFGHKTSDLIGAVATTLLGAHADNNGSITSCKLIETTGVDTGAINLNAAEIHAQTDAGRLDNNVSGTTAAGGDGFPLRHAVPRANQDATQLRRAKTIPCP